MDMVGLRVKYRMVPRSAVQPNILHRQPDSWQGGGIQQAQEGRGRSWTGF